MIIQPMQETDLDEVLTIQAQCYTEIEPESKASFNAKLLASPTTCFVAHDGNRIAGYLMSLPWVFSAPPTLNDEKCQQPNKPDCLYLHDLAVAPFTRQLGVGQLLVNRFFEQLQNCKLQRASLVAIQGSVPYWSRYGFQPVLPDISLKQKLESYGSHVSYMEYIA